jgi:hypothetical protein
MLRAELLVGHHVYREVKEPAGEPERAIAAPGEVECRLETTAPGSTEDELAEPRELLWLFRICEKSKKVLELLIAPVEMKVDRLVVLLIAPLRIFLQGLECWIIHLIEAFFSGMAGHAVSRFIKCTLRFHDSLIIRRGHDIE